MLLQKDPELTSNYRVTDIYFQITCIAEPGLSNNKKEATSDYTVQGGTRSAVFVVPLCF